VAVIALTMEHKVGSDALRANVTGAAGAASLSREMFAEILMMIALLRIARASRKRGPHRPGVSGMSVK